MRTATKVGLVKTNNTTRSTILIIDDVQQIRQLLGELLSAHDCRFAASAEEALAVLETCVFDLVLSDINMSGISGLNLVPLILERSPDTVVVMVSGEQGIESAIEAMRAGAFDYVIKPLDLRHVQAAVDRALAQHRLLVKKREYEDHLEDLVKERTAEIEHLAYHDRLTNLPNRASFLMKCEDAIAERCANDESGAVLLISLDRFKRISDTLGHAAGDVLLAAAADRLQENIGNKGTLARFDADEFALLLRDIQKESDPAEIATCIAEIMKPPFLVGNEEVFLTTSVGISRFPANGDSAATVLMNASAALQLAKQQGGNTLQLYVAEMSTRALTRFGLEMNLRRAVEANEFVTHYQPIINLASGDIVGVEALVRWQHPQLGLLSPVDFIGLAEDTGLILDIGGVVMSEACAQTRRWQENGMPGLRIAINVSPRQFRDRSFSDHLVNILCDGRLDPQSVELEITETTIMENFELAIQVLSELHKIGIRVSLDDFGTGYSSLSYLKQLPIDTVKVDRSFVIGATSDARDAALVMSIITLAHNLNLNVIAEGIETESQCDFLRLLSCNEGQGYLFGRPAAPEVIDWLPPNAQRKQNVHAIAQPGQRRSRAVNE